MEEEENLLFQLAVDGQDLRVADEGKGQDRNSVRRLWKKRWKWAEDDAMMKLHKPTASCVIWGKHRRGFLWQRAVIEGQCSFLRGPENPPLLSNSVSHFSMNKLLSAVALKTSAHVFIQVYNEGQM